MPSSLLNQLNLMCLQGLSVALVAALLAGLLARSSHRFLSALPPSAERSRLLQGVRLGWLIVPGGLLVGLGVFYGLCVGLRAPLLALTVGFATALLPLMLCAYLLPEALDAPSAGLAALLARPLRRRAEPEAWLAEHYRQAARRQRLGLLRHLIVALLVLLLIIGFAGHASLDGVLAMRLHSMAAAERIQQQMGLGVTVFSQTPPCVPLPTLDLIPAPGTTAAAARALAVQAEALLRKAGEGAAWRIVVKTGEGPPLAERNYVPTP